MSQCNIPGLVVIWNELATPVTPTICCYSSVSCDM